MLEITVSTMPGKPTFSVADDTSTRLVRKEVASRYGYQSIGVPHCWCGVWLPQLLPPVITHLTAGTSG
jgi:hypothetical protein